MEFIRTEPLLGPVWAPRQVSGCRNTGHPGSQRPMLVGRYHVGYGEPEGPAGEGHTGLCLDLAGSYLRIRR